MACGPSINNSLWLLADGVFVAKQPGAKCQEISDLKLINNTNDAASDLFLTDCWTFLFAVNAVQKL